MPCRNKHTERQKQYCGFPFPSLLANSCRYACAGSPQYCFSFVKRVESAWVVQLGCWRNAVRRPSQHAVLVRAARCIGLRSIVRFRHLPSAAFAVIACVGMFALPACLRRSAAPSRLISFLHRSLLFFPAWIASFWGLEIRFPVPLDSVRMSASKNSWAERAVCPTSFITFAIG